MLDLVDGFLVLDVLFQRAAADKVPIRFDLPPTSGFGQSGDHGRQIVDRRVAVADEQHLERCGGRLLADHRGLGNQENG